MAGHKHPGRTGLIRAPRERGLSHGHTGRREQGSVSPLRCQAGATHGGEEEASQIRAGRYSLTKHNTSVGCVWLEGQWFTSLDGTRDVGHRHAKQRELCKGKEAMKGSQGTRTGNVV